jgi:excisionase family DNA binding protein
MPNERSEWLTVSEVAAMLGTSTETIRRMIKAGELPASRASNAKRAAWLINAAAFERQRTADAERAAVRQRLGGVVVGRGEEFTERLGKAYPGVTVGSPQGPSLADHARAIAARHDLFDRVEREMAADPSIRQQLEQLEEEERFEAEAQELARRVRRAERLRDRALEILEEDDQDD